MKLHVIATGSKGNAYALESEAGEILLIECGINYTDIKKYFNFEMKKIIACIITHEHGDHVKGVKAAVKDGTLVFGTPGTINAVIEKHKIKHTHRIKPINIGTIYSVGNYKIWPFAISHDAAEPCGFLIKHHECGRIVFATDTNMIDYKFEDIQTYIIEANYQEDKLYSNYHAFLVDRIKAAHMSLNQCIKNLLDNDIASVRNIVIAHLSSTNIDADEAIAQVQQATGKYVSVARNNSVINLI